MQVHFVRFVGERRNEEKEKKNAHIISQVTGGGAVLAIIIRIAFLRWSQSNILRLYLSVSLSLKS